MRIATTLTMTAAGRTKVEADIKRKTTSDICQFLLHFTTYFHNVSYVNSKRPRMEGCSNEGKRSKAGGRKKRSRKLKTVKTGEEKGKRMEGREKGTKAISSEFLV